MSDHNQEPNIYHDWEARLRPAPEMIPPRTESKPDPNPKPNPNLDPELKTKPKPPLEPLKPAQE